MPGALDTRRILATLTNDATVGAPVVVKPFKVTTFKLDIAADALTTVAKGRPPTKDAYEQEPAWLTEASREIDVSDRSSDGDGDAADERTDGAEPDWLRDAGALVGYVRSRAAAPAAKPRTAKHKRRSKQ